MHLSWTTQAAAYQRGVGVLQDLSANLVFIERLPGNRLISSQDKTAPVCWTGMN
jgi:hypothetical protein